MMIVRAAACAIGIIKSRAWPSGRPAGSLIKNRLLAILANNQFEFGGAAAAAAQVYLVGRVRPGGCALKVGVISAAQRRPARGKGLNLVRRRWTELSNWPSVNGSGAHSKCNLQALGEKAQSEARLLARLSETQQQLTWDTTIERFDGSARVGASGVGRNQWNMTQV